MKQFQPSKDGQMDFLDAEGQIAARVESVANEPAAMRVRSRRFRGGLFTKSVEFDHGDATHEPSVTIRFTDEIAVEVAHRETATGNGIAASVGLGDGDGPEMTLNVEQARMVLELVRSKMRQSHFGAIKRKSPARHLVDLKNQLEEFVGVEEVPV